MTLDPKQPLHPGPLQFLSMGRDTRVPSPQERMAALHQYVETQFANVMLPQKFSQESK